MNRLLTWTVGSVACVVLASDAEAQLVRVGPFGGVSVRAPFVSVDTLPFGGGTRVRAPFVSVNTRAYAYGYGYGYRPYPYDYYRPYGPVYNDPVYYNPVVPTYRVPVYTPPLYPDVVYPQTGEYRTTQPPIAMEDSTTLSDRLRAAALQLKRSLSLRRDDSDVWLNYLAPDRIVQAIDSAADPSSLSDLLLNYEGVVGNGSLGSISRAGGFAETHRLLRAFVSGPADSGTQKASPMQVEPGENSILVPNSSSESNSQSKEPTPAARVKPADDEDNQEVRQDKEELPLPPPEPTPL